MNEHAGASCALSVLIVGVFAVLLHDRNPPPHQPASPPETTARIDVPKARPESSDPRPLPPLQSAVVAATPAEPSPRSVPAEPAVSQEPASILETVAVVNRSDPPSTSPPPALPTPTPPKVVQAGSVRAQGSFVEVKAGETLADVAVRVYGTVDAAASLWRANRDQLARLDSPLARGALLRTP